MLGPMEEMLCASSSVGTVPPSTTSKSLVMIAVVEGEGGGIGVSSGSSGLFQSGGSSTNDVSSATAWTGADSSPTRTKDPSEIVDSLILELAIHLA